MCIMDVLASHGIYSDLDDMWSWNHGRYGGCDGIYTPFSLRVAAILSAGRLPYFLDVNYSFVIISGSTDYLRNEKL